MSATSVSGMGLPRGRTTATSVLDGHTRSGETEAIVIIKAAPQVGQRHGETVCCAGIDLQGNWLRLYPISFRTLDEGKKFGRWDRVRFKWRLSNDDRRIESRRVDQDSLEILGKLRKTERERFLASSIVTSLDKERAEGRSLALLQARSALESVVQAKDLETAEQALHPALAAERAVLRPLPASRVPDYTTYRAVVRRWSTVRLGSRAYSVPSRLIGHEVEVRQHPDEVEVLFAGRVVERMPRLRGEQDVRVDYRHVIWSLVRKPGAFARYRYREELFPTLPFRQAYDALRGWRGERADVEYVRVLHLAASTLESRVERALVALLDAGEAFDYAAVKALAHPEKTAVPQVHIPAPDLGAYDRLLEVGQ